MLATPQPYAYETTGSLHHLAPRASVEKPRSLSPVHPGSADTSPSPKVPGPRFSDPAPASRRGVCARPSSAAVLAERTTALEAACSSPERDCPRPRLSPRHTLAPDADTPSAVARARASRCCALDLWRCVCRRAGSSAGAESRGLGSDGGGHCSSSSLLLVDVEHRLRGHRSPPPLRRKWRCGRKELV